MTNNRNQNMQFTELPANAGAWEKDTLALHVIRYSSVNSHTFANSTCFAKSSHNVNSPQLFCFSPISVVLPIVSTIGPVECSTSVSHSIYRGCSSGYSFEEHEWMLFNCFRLFLRRTAVSSRKCIYLKLPWIWWKTVISHWLNVIMVQ